MTSMLRISACVLLLTAACDSYVKYDEDTKGTSGNTQDAGDLGIDLVGEDKFDHKLFTGLLSEYVAVNGQQTLLKYDAIANSPTASAALADYRAALAKADPDKLVGTNEKLAFWMNAYNASVIAGVIEKRKANPAFRVDEEVFVFFDDRVFTIAGAQVALDEIEQGIIRGDLEDASVVDSPNKAKVKAWHESLWNGAKVNPRIHVGLNCAALSCPNLQQKAWDGATLEADLQNALRAWLADPVKGAGPNGVSMLFTFYKRDFEVEGGSVSAFIEKNREGGLNGVAVDKSLEYDWALNVAP